MLTIEKIKNLIKPVCDEYPINKVYLFGSYSRGDAKESSDVDLRIEGDIHNLFTLGGIYEDMKEALGKELDLLSVLPDSEKFRENLKRDEVLIYER